MCLYQSLQDTETKIDGGTLKQNIDAFKDTYMHIKLHSAENLP